MTARMRVGFVCLALLPATAFALATGQVWEDAYIAFRHAANLSAGAGLSYQPGERIQGFSSPLATLLMAVACAVAGPGPVALALFRGASLAALALALAALWDALARGLGEAAPMAVLVPLAFFALESKTIAFSANGMETGLLLLFAALALREIAVGAGARPRWLAFAWAGLVWTRPDGALYAAAMALATVAFAAGERLRVVRSLTRSALLAMFLYAPWLAFSIWYYGTPLPLTVVAKLPDPGSTGLLGALGRVPRIWAGLYLPPYSEYGGWDWARLPGGVLAAAATLYWLLPRGRRFARAASLVAATGVAYLALMPRTYPWYFPVVVLASLPALGALLADAAARLPAGRGRWLPAGAGVAALAALAVLLLDYGRLARVTQAVVEDGHRRELGLWLRRSAGADDRVFLECPGYIGYFSGLRILDYPGLVSPAVLEARRSGARDLAAAGMALHPEWMALRPLEVEMFHAARPGWLAREYQVATVFDVRAQLEERLPQNPAVLYDATFVVLRRR